MNKIMKDRMKEESTVKIIKGDVYVTIGKETFCVYGMLARAWLKYKGIKIEDNHV